MTEIQPVREFVASVVGRLHHVETHWVPEGRATPQPYAETMEIFDQVLAEHDRKIAATPCVKPSREDVARVIVNHSGHLGTHYMDVALAAADAVLALLPGRTEAEVKAEALEEAASVYDVAQISGVFFGAAEYPKAWLRARAASLRGESNG